MALNPFVCTAEDLDNLSLNQYDPDSIANHFRAGNPYRADGLLNEFSPYGSPFSNKSWSNPFATDAPRLYDQDGNYRGTLSTNQFDPDSISNPFGPGWHIEGR